MSSRIENPGYACVNVRFFRLIVSVRFGSVRSLYPTRESCCCCQIKLAW